MPTRSCRFFSSDLHLLAQLAVERGHRLVEQQHLRLEHERARERHALPLPAGELVDGALAEAVEADHLQRLRDVRRDLRRADVPRISSPKATLPATLRCGKSA